MKATKEKFTQRRDFNKKRLSYVQTNLKDIIQNDAFALTLEEKSSISYIIKVADKLLVKWEKAKIKT